MVAFLFPYDYRKKLSDIENKLHSIYRSSLDALGKRIAGDPGTERRNTELRREGRATSLEYGNICGAIIWNRVRDFRRKGYYTARARLALDIYRNFFPLFSITRRFSLEGREFPFRSRIVSLLSNLSGVLGKKKGPPGEAGDPEYKKLREEVDGILIDLDKKEAEAAPGSDPDRLLERLFSARVFLYHLRLLIENFRRDRTELWNKGD